MFGQQIIFEVAGLLYSLDGLRVVSVEASIRTEYLTGSPSCIIGVTDFRGEPVPVIDLYKKFGAAGSEPSTSQYIFVTSAIGTYGVPVDAIREICAVDLSATMELPSLAANARTEFIKGIISHKGELVSMLDQNRLLTDSEIVRLKTAMKGFVDMREANKQEEIRLLKLKEEAEARAKAEAEAGKAAAEAEKKAKAEEAKKAKAEAEVKPAARAEAKPKSEPKPAAKAEAKTEAKPKAEPKSKTEVKPKSEPKPAVKSEAKPKTEAKPAVKSEAKPKTEAKPAKAKKSE